MIGNNRTKNQLVGQMGIVKNATGLGGWHRVVSTILFLRDQAVLLPGWLHAL